MKPPKLKQIVSLLLVAEEAGVQRLAWYLIGRDPLTGPLLGDLQALSRDAGIRIGSRHWALSAFELNRQVDLLITSDGRSWKSSNDLLDPERVVGVDRDGLLTVIVARIKQSRGGSGNYCRLRRLATRLQKELRLASERRRTTAIEASEGHHFANKN